MNNEPRKPIFSDYLVTLTVRVSATNHYAAGVTATDGLTSTGMCNSVHVLSSVPTEPTPHRRRSDLPLPEPTTTATPGPFTPETVIADVLSSTQTTATDIAASVIASGTTHV